jgi:chemotaxis signal transduction protein
MDDALDLDLDLGGDSPAPAAAPAEAERAQGIDCGGLGVALPYSWARNMVEQFELSQVPNAPPWMAGAANVDGRIVAVIDLGAWLWPDRPPTDTLRSRLLLGGDGDDSLALRFTGLPTLMRVQAQPCDAPLRLQPFVCGSARVSGSDDAWPVIDMPALSRAWAADLASPTA